MHHLNVNNVELETLPPWSCFRFDLVFYCIFDWLWESLSIQSIKIQTYSSYFQPYPCYSYSSRSRYHILTIMSASHSNVLKFISCKIMVKSSCKKLSWIIFLCDIPWLTIHYSNNWPCWPKQFGNWQLIAKRSKLTQTIHSNIIYVPLQTSDFQTHLVFLRIPLLSSQTGGIVEDAYFMIGIGNKQSFARKI